MNSKERVKRAFHFERPDKIPNSFLSLASDFFPVFSRVPKSWQPKELPPQAGGDSRMANRIYRGLVYSWKKKYQKRTDFPKKWWNYPGKRVDEWGTIWQSSGIKSGDLTFGHPVLGPLEESWDGFDDYEIPDPNLEERYKFIKSKLWHRLGKRRYTLGMFAVDGILHRCCHIRGFSNFLMDLVRKPKKAESLIKRVLSFCLIQAEKYFEYYPGLNSFFVFEDLGSQVSPFISPRIFDKFIGPTYKQLADIAHDNDADFIMHSCGQILELIPSLIKTGVDVLEFDSPHMTGVENFKHFAEERKMAFWCCSNIQSTYVRGTPLQIEEEVKMLIKEIGNNEGGLAIFEYPTNSALGTPKPNIKAMRKATKKWGNYNQIGVIEWLA